jgi:hypothetical protein
VQKLVKIPALTMQEHYKGKKKLGYGREKICLLIGASKSITMKKKKN